MERFLVSVEDAKSIYKYNDVMLRMFDSKLSDWIPLFERSEALSFIFTFASIFTNQKVFLDRTNYRNITPISEIEGVSLYFSNMTIAPLTEVVLDKYENLSQKKKDSLRPALVSLCALLSLLRNSPVKPYAFKVLQCNE